MPTFTTLKIKRLPEKRGATQSYLTYLDSWAESVLKFFALDETFFLHKPPGMLKSFFVLNCSCTLLLKGKQVGNL